MEIRNAIITNCRIDDADRGFLTAWLDLDYGGICQSFGGYTLYLPKSFKNHNKDDRNFTGEFLWRCMECAGVTNWDDIPGKTIRVKHENGLIKGIGHIVKDIWFSPSEEWGKDD